MGSLKALGLLSLAMTLAVSACGGDDEDPIDSVGGSGGKSDAGKGGSGGKGGTGGGKDGGSDAATGGAAGSAGAADAGEDTMAEGAAGSGGAAGSDGGADTGTDGATCADTLNEPNESETATYGLAGVDDCDATKEHSGILGTTDVDWFKFVGTDNLITCTPNAKVVVDDSTMRVCVFAECTGGQTTNVSCNAGTATQSPAGRAGCCATGTAADAKVTCSGLTGANADMYVRVDHPSGPICKSYKLTYNY